MGSLAKIEKLLNDHPDVAEVAVFEAPGPDAPQRIVALTMRFYGSGVDIRDHLWDSVDRDDLPDVLVVLPSLPRDDAGLLRTADIHPDRVDPSSLSHFASPQAGTEEVLAGIWCDVLGRGRVGALDNFLDLGGDSMSAGLLNQLVNERFGRDLSVADILDAPHLRGLAETIDGPRAAG
jgi:hypothetical protein